MEETLSPSWRTLKAVWDYPVSDKYTNMWRFMTDYHSTFLPNNVDQALEMVLATNKDGGFAYIGEASQIKYITMSDCRFQIVGVGKEFNKKPYGIGLQQKSKLRSALNEQILELTRSGWLPNLKEKWWNYYPNCSSTTTMDSGQSIGISNLMGLFLVIGGMLAVCVVTLIVEFLYYEEKLCVKHYKEHHPHKNGHKTSAEPKASEDVAVAEPIPKNIYDVQDLDAKNIPYVVQPN